MKRVILECVKDGAGTLGLIAQGMKVMADEPMASNDGALIAHDLIEHINGLKAIGSIDDELEALGAVWFVRGQFGELRRRQFAYRDVCESIGYDVMNLGMIYMRKVGFRNPAPDTRAGHEETTFQEILRHGKDTLIRELECNDDEIDHDRMAEYFDDAIHYIRTGYRKARKKYGEGYAINNVFWNIADAVDPHAKSCEFEGQLFELTYDQNSARCEEHYPEYY